MLVVASLESQTTLGNGYLGSRIDEERSKMRYLVWIAESREPSSFWTQVAPKAIRPRARLPGRHASRRPNHAPLIGTHGIGAEIGLPCLWCGWPKLESPSVDARLVVVEKTLVLCRASWAVREALDEDPNVSSWDDASTATPGQAGLPAEFKHINKRRKRNQPGLPQ